MRGCARRWATYPLTWGSKLLTSLPPPTLTVSAARQGSWCLPFRALCPILYCNLKVARSDRRMTDNAPADGHYKTPAD